MVRELFTDLGTSDEDLAFVAASFGLPDTALTEFAATLQAPSVADELLWSQRQRAFYADCLSDSWFCSGQLEQVCRTGKGSKPGDPLADLFFGFVLRKILRDIADDLAHEGLAHRVPAADASRCTANGTWLPVSDVTYADDMVFFCIATSYPSLCSETIEVMRIVFHSLARHGMRVNMKERKTEAIFHLWAAGCMAARRTTYAGEQQSLEVRTMYAGTHRLRIVHRYRHLGGAINAAANMRPEVTFEGRHLLGHGAEVQQDDLPQP